MVSQDFNALFTILCCVQSYIYHFHKSKKHEAFLLTRSIAEIPEYVPGAAYRQLEFLLGRIDNLTVQGDFTTQSGNYTGTTPPSPYYNTTDSSVVNLTRW